MSLFLYVGGVAQMVERLLCMQKAQGSIPCSSNFFSFFFFFFHKKKNEKKKEKKNALAGIWTRVAGTIVRVVTTRPRVLYIWDNIFCVTKIRFLGWLSWDLPWLYRDPAWLYRDLGWLCRDLAWFCRGLAWLYRDLAWLYRKLACALGLDFPQDTTRRDHHLDVVSEWLRR